MAFSGLYTKRTYKILHRLFSTSTSVKQDLIKVQSDNGLRTIMLNDSKTRNALSLKMMEEMIEAINADKESPELRSIVIKAAAGPVFSAGHNLKELTSEQGVEMQQKVFATCGQLMMSIQKAEVPVIALVDGLAAAAGCQLVAACDIALASENSKFSTPGANFGVFCSTPGVTVSRKANRATASYMVFTGLPITALEAQQAGLISRIARSDKLDETVQEIYDSIRSKSRPIVKLGKEFFYRQLEIPYAEALKQGGEIMVKNLQLKDSQEGLLSFKEKRKPTWTHKNDETTSK